jgi:hypothetical protein
MQEDLSVATEDHTTRPSDAGAVLLLLPGCYLLAGSVEPLTTVPAGPTAKPSVP